VKFGTTQMMIITMEPLDLMLVQVTMIQRFESLGHTVSYVDRMIRRMDNAEQKIERSILFQQTHISNFRTSSCIFCNKLGVWLGKPQRVPSAFFHEKLGVAFVGRGVRISRRETIVRRQGGTESAVIFV
jgi:hypothetical protein